MEAKSIEKIIHANRKKKSFAQKTLADRFGVPDGDVSKWERDITCPEVNTSPKFAEVLEIPEELPIHIPADFKSDGIPEYDEQNNRSAKSMESLEESDLDVVKCAIYKENVKHLLRQGLVGFLMGFSFALFTFSADEEPINFLMAFAVGFFFSGIPYGWGLLTKVIGNWVVTGSIPIMLLVFSFKFLGSILISWVAYPIALLYNLIRAQRKGSKLQVVFIILLALWISLFAGAFLL